MDENLSQQKAIWQCYSEFLISKFRSLTAATPSRSAEIISQVPRDTYLIPKTEHQRSQSPQQIPTRSVQNYLGNDHLRLQTFNVQARGPTVLFLNQR